VNIVQRVRNMLRGSSPVQTKALTIVDDGFIPHDVVQLSALMSGRSEEGLDANVIMAPVAWIMRTFPDAIARVQRKTGDKWDWVERHDASRRIARPNPWYNGDALWQATCLSYVLNGNGYWQKVRNGVGQVVQLWYRPHWAIKPHAPPDGSAFIDYYEHQTPRGIERLNVRDIVHFRFGLDPRDPRYGFSPLRTLLREVMTDEEAARFSIRILENMGIPGVVVSPTLNPTGDSFEPQRDEIEALKDYINTAFTGAGRGSTLVFGKPTTVTQFGFDPAKLTLGEIRDISEERVCAMLGLPAAVVGFGSGLEANKVGATMQALVKQAWRQCLFPMQRSMARQLDDQLLSDYVANYEDRERIRFDVSDAVSLQEDAAELSTRVCNEVAAGIVRVDQAQALLGHEVDDTQKVYLRSMTVMPVPAETVPEPVVHPQDARALEADREAAAASAEENLKMDMDDIRAIAARYRGNGNGHHTEEAA
jgi:HK97 family phage portal protein